MRITVSSTTNCSRRSARRSAAKSPRPTFFNHPIQPLKQDRKDRIFQSFIFSLSQNFRTHHSVSFYAAEQCLTPRYFSTIIREKSGRNALQWIMMFIIAEAKKLLSDPDPSIKEIAETLGFSNQSLLRPLFQKAIRRSRRWHSAPPARRSNARTKQGAERTSFCPLYFGPPARSCGHPVKESSTPARRADRHRRASREAARSSVRAAPVRCGPTPTERMPPHRAPVADRRDRRPPHRARPRRPPPRRTSCTRARASAISAA